MKAWPLLLALLLFPVGLVAQQDKAIAEIRDRVRATLDLGFTREFEAAEEELEMARQASRACGGCDPGWIPLMESRLEIFRGVSLEAARARLLRVLEARSGIDDSTGDADTDLERECLRSLVLVSQNLGLYRQAESYAKRAFVLMTEAGDLREEASARYDLAVALMDFELPWKGSRKRILGELRKALAVAEKAEDPVIEALSLRLLAELEGGPEAGKYLERSVRLAREFAPRSWIYLRSCLLSLATHRLREDPAEAWRLLGEAYASPLDHHDPWALLYGWEDHLRVVWATRSRKEALDRSLLVLDAIESLRHSQVGEGRDRLLSAWADPYYWISGRLLLDQPGSNDLRGAYSIFERLRAQALRESVELGWGGAPEIPQELIPRWQDLYRRQVELYQRLLDPGSDREDEAQARRELERVEQGLDEILRGLEPPGSARFLLDPPELDLLDQVEESLAEDEALLSFQFGLREGHDRRFAGGAWLTVSTHQGSRVYELEEDRAGLDAGIDLYLRMPDPGEEAFVSRLYEGLLEPALDDLPGGILRLVIVPDGSLHFLPFALLRPAAESDPESPALIERFELSRVPSAHLWLDWRESGSSSVEIGTGNGAALVLANPTIQTQDSAEPRFGALPFAEKEGKRVMARLRGKSRRVSGAEASERFLKTVDLGEYSILHLAAHARVDDRNSSRSGVLLAGGGENEDGRLRPPEIAALEGLKGKLVVLSACETAAGEVLRGEGVLSLARAFFQARARTVVATLKPLGDREAMIFFDDFYRYLSRGVSVREALASTQRRWIAEGRPASTWAQVVVLGDGDLIPVPGGVDRSQYRAAVAAGILFLATLTVLGIWRGRHLRRLDSLPD